MPPQKSPSPFWVVGISLLFLFVGPEFLTAGVNLNVEYVRKSVVFLYSADAAGNVDKALGTAFIVEVPLVSQPGRAYKLLVTARHIVDPVWATCLGQNPTKIFMRVNKKDFDPKKDESGTADLPVWLSDSNNPRGFFTSDDPDVDAAVMILIGSNITDYDLGAVRVADFPTDDELKVFAEGDTVVSAGLLPGASGKKRNYPFFKFGNVSSIPAEPAELPCGTDVRPIKVWFIAANLAPGNSGSPIFYAPPGFAGLTGGPNPRPVFLGIQSMSMLGYDVAGMTPANYVYQIIKDMKLEDADLTRGPKPKPATPPPPATPAKEPDKK